MKVTDIRISSRDWRSLTYNVFSEDLKGKSATTKFPPLKKAWQNYKMDLSVEKYVIAVYDLNSPLLTAYTDQVELKIAAGLLAGFPIDTETGLFEAQYDDILNCRNPRVNRNIIEFVSLFGSSIYSHYVNLRMAYDKIVIELNSIEPDETTKTNAELAKLRADASIKLNQVYELMRAAEIDFLRDKSALLKQDLYRVVSQQLQTLMISPERRLLKQD